MITKYLTSLTSTFNPLSRQRAHKIPRLILSFLSADARTPSGGGIKVTTNILPANSTAPSILSVVFKDGKEVKFSEGVERGAEEGKKKKVDVENRFDLGLLTVKDVVDELDRHSRGLKRKDELSGS